jgi:hypothetical protein
MKLGAADGMFEVIYTTYSVAVFFCEGGNDGGEILLFVLLGSLPPAALIAFLVDLLILVVV